MWTKETGKIVEIYKKSGKCKKRAVPEGLVPFMIEGRKEEKERIG